MRHFTSRRGCRRRRRRPRCRHPRRRGRRRCRRRCPLHEKTVFAQMYEFAVCSIFCLKFTTQLLKVSSNPPGKNQRSTAPRTTHTSIKTFFRAINRPVYLIGFFIHQTLLSARTHFLGDFGLEHIP